MSQLCVILLVLFKFISIYGHLGETVVVFPPAETRMVDRYPYTPQFQTDRNPHRQQHILHTNRMPPQPSNEKLNGEHITFNEYTKALNEEKSPTFEESTVFRTAANIERDNNESSYRPYPGPYPRPGAPPYGSPPAYQNTSPVAVTPTPELPKLPLLKPDLSKLFKPVTTKVSSKVSGLLGLILALFSGSSEGGLKMNGLKDLVINGIVKPLLEAKGGIKALISKLSIPVISLLLINLEVLIIVWWLWEDCEPQKAPVPTYSYPKPAYNYNNYNSYR